MEQKENKEELLPEEKIMFSIIPGGCINLHSYKIEKESILKAMRVFAKQEKSSILNELPSEEELGKLERSIVAADPLFADLILKDLKSQIDSIISKIRKHHE